MRSQYKTNFARILLAFSICLPVAGFAGCGGSTGPKKLTPKEDVDWDAIRARDAAMADQSDANEDGAEE